jgi:hypothetical protein
MNGLKKRIADLELMQPQLDPITIIIRFLAPGNLCSPFNRLSLHGGPAWVRESSESEIDFENRVLLEVRSNQSSANNLIFVTGG